ncbi:MAG: hypothetical protein ACJAV2_004019 [Myxococcota bacterium]
MFNEDRLSTGVMNPPNPMPQVAQSVASLVVETYLTWLAVHPANRDDKRCGQTRQ